MSFYPKFQRVESSFWESILQGQGYYPPQILYCIPIDMHYILDNVYQGSYEEVGL